jgi:hypothetical protein
MQRCASAVGQVVYRPELDFLLSQIVIYDWLANAGASHSANRFFISPYALLIVSSSQVSTHF